MIKDILVPWVNADSERSVADAALALAAGSGAHVAVLVAEVEFALLVVEQQEH